jgi:hypothetical protein
MSKQPADGTSFAKIVVIFAVSLGIGLGLCGLGFFLNAHGVGRGSEEFGGVQPMGVLSLLIIVVSSFGLVVSLLAWAVAGMLRSFGWLGGNDPQRLFDDSEKEKRGEGQDP